MNTSMFSIPTFMIACALLPAVVSVSALPLAASLASAASPQHQVFFVLYGVMTDTIAVSTDASSASPSNQDSVFNAAVSLEEVDAVMAARVSNTLE